MQCTEMLVRLIVQLDAPLLYSPSGWHMVDHEVHILLTVNMDYLVVNDNGDTINWKILTQEYFVLAI